jgi:hypothetical protein
MDEIDTERPRKKFDLLTAVIISAFIGVLFSIAAITLKRLNPAADKTAVTLFYIGLVFAVPAIFYITYYIIMMFTSKTPTDYEEEMQKVSLFERIRDTEPPKLEPEYYEIDKLAPHYNIDEISGKVAKEAMNARIREIEKQLKRPTYEDTMDDIYATEDAYAQEVPKDAFFAAAAPQKTAAAQVSAAPEKPASVQAANGTAAEAKIAPPPKRERKAVTDDEKQKIQNKKLLFTQENLERYLRIYFVETISCFLMDRDKYIDYFGIAPYNKITIKPSKIPGVHDEVIYTMTATKPKLYKFATYLVDLERFITHEQLYHNFIASIEAGKSLVRISEQLHKLYRKLYKTDFVNNFTNKEDFDNLLILVSNNYILGNNDFRHIFTKVPFEIPNGFTEDNIIRYLSNPVIKEKFMENFPNYGDIGFDNVWDAMYICFINSVKGKLTIKQLESAATTDHKRISKALARADKQLQRELTRAKRNAA